MGLKEEQKLKTKYLLATEEFDGIQIVKLTTDNIARVEGWLWLILAMPSQVM